MNRATWQRAGGILAACLLVGVPATAGAAGGSPDRVAPATSSGRAIEAIVGLKPGTSASEARRLVRRHGGRVTGELRLIRALTVRIGALQADRLRQQAGIASVTRNSAVRTKAISPKKLTTAYPQATNVFNVWNRTNITGRGVGIAVIDTGVAGGLADFRSAKDGTSRVIATAVVHPEATSAGDGFGHGTHVAGIAAGNSTVRSTSDPQYGKRVGIAPEANIVSVKVSNDDGAATVIDVIRGLQFAVDHKDAYGIRIVNLSLESTAIQSYRTDPLAAAAEAAWFSGLVVVSAAGNRGTAADAVNRAPGNDPFVISVGGVDDQATQSTSDDTIASWTSRGTTQDGFSKPEIYATGSKMVSNLAPNSDFASMCPKCIVDGEYIRAGGTSMAAPVVSGLIALMLEKNPKLTPDEVKGILLEEVRLLPGGIPAADAEAALRRASSSTTNFPVANVGVVPNDLIDPATGGIDYTRSSWSRSSWSSAAGALTATWARSSWSCSCLSGLEDVATSRSSWSRSSWSTAWGL